MNSLILERIAVERAYKDRKWGYEIDRLNTPHHWTSYICQYATKNCIGDPRLPVDIEKFKEDMVAVAALAIAALEAIEKKDLV
jgi:hypothetical protein